MRKSKRSKDKDKELFQKGEKGMKYSIFKIYKKIGTFAIGNKHHKKETLVAYEISGAG